MIQSILIPKSKFSLKQANNWIIQHGYKIKKIDITDNYYRYRQEEPKLKNFRIFKLNNGIELINMY